MLVTVVAAAVVLVAGVGVKLPEGRIGNADHGGEGCNLVARGRVAQYAAIVEDDDVPAVRAHSFIVTRAKRGGFR